MRHFLLFCCACAISVNAYAWWDDLIPEKTAGPGLVFAENCNVRETASPKGKVLFQLQPGDPVTILEKSEISTRIGEKTEYWYRIKAATGRPRGEIRLPNPAPSASPVMKSPLSSAMRSNTRPTWDW